ncbi:MAG: (d)CMP kinase [Methanoculleaceae archaeon]
MRITISGPPGSGTTSLARQLAVERNMRVVSAGEIFRQLAMERGMDLAGFSRCAESDPSIDRLIDERQAQIGMEEDDIILEGRLSGWMVKNADLRIWLNASTECRASRIAARDGHRLEEARIMTVERERSEARRYMEYYDIDINDLSIYHLVLSSEKWEVEALAAIVNAAIDWL